MYILKHSEDSTGERKHKETKGKNKLKLYFKVGQQSEYYQDLETK